MKMGMVRRAVTHLNSSVCIDLFSMKSIPVPFVLILQNVSVVLFQHPQFVWQLCLCVRRHSAVQKSEGNLPKKAKIMGRMRQGFKYQNGEPDHGDV